MLKFEIVPAYHSNSNTNIFNEILRLLITSNWWVIPLPSGLNYGIQTSWPMKKQRLEAFSPCNGRGNVFRSVWSTMKKKLIRKTNVEKSLVHLSFFGVRKGDNFSLWLQLSVNSMGIELWCFSTRLNSS